jgi:hypothetical protein
MAITLTAKSLGEEVEVQGVENLQDVTIISTKLEEMKEDTSSITTTRAGPRSVWLTPKES